ncbi:MAG: ferrous iron transport protein A [Burkholderiales bacterium]|nr:ferrous iron transport protein A [Burkholderiales bacterium]
MDLPRTLAQLAYGEAALICALQAPPGLPGCSRQLEDMGFVPGELVRVLRRALLPEGPLVVRLGEGATFALRHQEAACIHVEAA